MGVMDTVQEQDMLGAVDAHLQEAAQVLTTACVLYNVNSSVEVFAHA